MQPYGETEAFSPEKPSLSTRETSLSVHGLGPYAFEEGQIMVLLKPLLFNALF
jgi:hypothetical protein